LNGFLADAGNVNPAGSQPAPNQDERPWVQRFRVFPFNNVEGGSVLFAPGPDRAAGCADNPDRVGFDPDS